MLDPRIYRAAFLPIIFALLVAAFSLENRPASLRTTVAPDAFDGARAMQTLTALTAAYPSRRAGSDGDAAFARAIAARLRGLVGPDADAAGEPPVRTVVRRAQTLDGEQDVTDVIATRPGQPGPALVVVAHRDARSRGSEADLSGTAAMLELARLAQRGGLRRTVTFISTSGASGGLAGAKAAAADLAGQPIDAVVVLGDMAGRTLRRPFVVPYADGGKMAPLVLRRTMESALRTELGSDPGGPRASTQFVRRVAAVTPTEQGPFGAEGIPAVAISVDGERAPAAGAPVTESRMAAFGRGVLRGLLSLDTGPDIKGAPGDYLVTKRKLMPAWALRLVGGALLLPVWLATLDGFARARRRRAGTARWLGWVLGAALPFLLCGALARLFAVAKLIDPAPAALVPAGALSADATAWVALVVLVAVAALVWLVLRPALARVLGTTGAPAGAGPASAVALAITLLSLGWWIVDPYTAIVLVPAAHLWLLAVAPEVRVPRAAGVVLGLAALLAPLAVLVSVFGQLGYGIGGTLYSLVLLVAGGGIGPLRWIAWALYAGIAVAAVTVGSRPRADDEIKPDEVRMRGPLGYAGPGSLGGTDSALRR